MFIDDEGYAKYWFWRGAIAVLLGLVVLVWADPGWPFLARLAIGLAAMSFGAAGMVLSIERERRPRWVYGLMPLAFAFAGIANVSLGAAGRGVVLGWVMAGVGAVVFVGVLLWPRKP